VRARLPRSMTAQRALSIALATKTCASMAASVDPSSRSHRIRSMLPKDRPGCQRTSARRNLSATPTLSPLRSPTDRRSADWILYGQVLRLNELLARRPLALLTQQG
jgi:hypothetical protein